MDAAFIFTHVLLSDEGTKGFWESRAKAYGPINKADFSRSPVTENTLRIKVTNMCFINDSRCTLIPIPAKPMFSGEKHQ